MEPGGSMPHSQGQAESTQLPGLIPISSRSILILSSYLSLGLTKDLFPVGLPVKILKALLPSYMPCPCQSSSYFNFNKII